MDIQHIVNEYAYEALIQRYPQLDTLDKSIFKHDWFFGLTVTPDTKRPSQWRATFYNDNGERTQITETQAVQFLMIVKGHEYEQACAGRVNWNGCETFNIEPTPARNFYKMVRRFFPKNTDAEVIHNGFFKRIAIATDGWNDDSRNFLNSKAAKNVMYFVKQQRFEKVQTGKHEYNEEQVRNLAEVYYKEEMEARGNQMGTAVDREIVAEKSSARLLEETGYQYLMTEYDVDLAWIDSNATEICKLLVPDFWNRLCEVCTMIFPNASAGQIELADEYQNPLCKTRQYKKSMLRGWHNFCELFHLTADDYAEPGNRNLETQEFVVKQITMAVNDINIERNVHMSPEKEFEIVSDLTDYFFIRRKHIAELCD